MRRGTTVVAGARTKQRLSLQVLGPVEAQLDGAPVDLGSPKQRCVLAVLALHEGAVIPRDRLADAIWGDDGLRTRAHALQTYISGLRSALGHDRVVTQGHGYALLTTPEELDLSRLRHLHRRAHDARVRGDTAEALDLLEAAVQLVRGNVVADVADRMERLEPVLAAEGEVAGCREALAAVLLDVDRPAEALDVLRSVRSAHPLRESAVALELRALAANGRRPEALAAFEAHRRRLIDELGADPAEEIRALHLELLAPHSEPSRPDEAATATTRDLRSSAPREPTGRGRTPRRAIRLAGVVLGVALAGIAVASVLGSSRHETILVLDAEPGWFEDLLLAGRDRAISELDVDITDVRPLRGDESIEPWVDAACRGEVDALIFGGPVFFDEIATAVACGVEDVTIIDADDALLAQPWVEETTRVRLRVQEAAFLAGMAAATATRTGKVGVIAGMDVPPIGPFVAGFVGGVHHVREDVDVLVQYLADPWSDRAQFERAFYEPAAGQAAAAHLTSSGADVLFAVAGISGEGALPVAQQESSDGSPVWVIGVDSDWQRVHGERYGRVILGSVTKGLDVAVVEAVRDDLRDPGGARRIDLGLAEGAVDFADVLGHAQDSRDARDLARPAIIRGELDVPSSYEGPTLPLLGERISDR